MSEQIPFLSEEYESNRNIKAHAINQYTLLISKSMGLDPAEVKRNLISYFKANKEKFKSRRAKIIMKNKHGDREVKIVPLSFVFKHVQEKNYHFSPSMVAYTNSDEEECVNSIGTRLFIDNRAHYKGLRQVAKAEGNKDAENKYNELQNAFKIFNNAQSGAMSSEGTPINNKTGHTTLTSSTRCLTSTANLINEQLIAGNRFYNTPDNTLQALTARLQVTDFKLLQDVMEKYKLHYPTPEDVMAQIEYSSKRYWRSKELMGIISDFVTGMTPLERAAILYILDFPALFRHNREFMTGFFDEWTAIKDVDGKEIPPRNGDDYIHCISKLDSKPPKEEINKLNAYHISVEEKYSDLIKVIFKSAIPPSGLFDVTTAIRDAVLTSDTDSSIYTVDQLIETYTDSREIGMRMNATLTYFIRMVSVDQHKQLSCNMNVSKRNLHMLNMKNEYYFGGYVTTLMSKHYYASQRMVEGVKNHEMKMEIKGVHLKSSKIAHEVRNYAKKMMERTIDAIENREQLEAAEILGEVADMERGVINDINTGVWTWLSKQSVKQAEYYKNPEGSVFFYHDLWEKVFKDKYGPAPELPYTGIKINVDIGNKTKLNRWIEGIQDEGLRNRLADFFTNVKRDSLNSIILPMERLQFMNDIPEEVKAIIDYRSTIKQNFKSIYTVLESMGVYLINDDITRLVSDEH